ncbi:MAG: hypothetical protein EBY17_03375 [Acidobacteriia bacterium]|nr:hypothetical protein [Terriglobia bacterium]
MPSDGRCSAVYKRRIQRTGAITFDIYLPEWLARYNKWIFGALFVLGELAVVVMWFRQGQM